MASVLNKCFDVDLISFSQRAKSFVFCGLEEHLFQGFFFFSGSSGGICEKSKLYSDGKKKSLNTGIITVQNYASHVPPKVSHITFAHEVGHNFGSPVSYRYVPQFCLVSLLEVYCHLFFHPLIVFFPLLAPSTTLGLSAPQENPRARTRRKRAIISCMRELHQETSSTTISSPSVAFATSAKSWKKREATVLLVRFTAYTGLYYLTARLLLTE